MRLPIKEPKRKKAIECITGQLLANIVTDRSISQSRDEILNTLSHKEIKIQSEWGRIELPKDLPVIKNSTWRPEKVYKWFLFYSRRRKVWEEIRRKKLEDDITEYISHLTSQEIPNIRELCELVESQKQLNFRIIRISGFSIDFPFVKQYIRSADNATLNRILRITNRKIRKNLREEQLRKELQEHLERIYFSVDVREVVYLSKDLIGVNVYINGHKYLFDFEGSFHELKHSFKNIIPDEPTYRPKAIGIDLAGFDNLLTATDGFSVFYIGYHDDIDLKLNNLISWIQKRQCPVILPNPIEAGGTINDKIPLFEKLSRGITIREQLKDKLRKLKIPFREVSGKNSKTRCSNCGKDITQNDWLILEESDMDKR